MCGISGIIYQQARPGISESVQRMADTLAHRGPDGSGLWTSDQGTVALGHRRLSVIDRSEAGNQPMHCLQRYRIVHNGEIYNYIELRDTLEKKGYQFHSATDTEVIALAYDCWKEDCVNYFDGMFAFAIWDEKEQQLFAARDRFGEKPFFYYFDGNLFLFASEMKALWAAGIEKIPNQKMLFNFITIGYTGNPARPEETFYEQVFKLPPATVLKFSTIYFQFSLQQYWHIDPEEQQEIKEEDALAQFSTLLQDAVSKRMRSDIPVGHSLSGGLDSAAIAALSSRIKAGSDSHHCFTASFPGFEKDETERAALVAAHTGLQQSTVIVSGEEMLRDWDKLVYHQEEPFGSASIYAQFKVYELAAKNNIRVLLDGQGADEILAGYHKYYKWYWQELYRKRQLKKSGELAAARRRGITESFTWQNKIAAYFPSFASIVMERQYLLRALKQEDLSSDFIRLQSREAYYTPPEHFDLNGVLWFNTFTHGLEELLRFADRNAMAHGCEVRLPFLSHTLVEFVFALPAQFKIRDGLTKWLLRQSVQTYLPESVVQRADKTGFEPPQASWMQTPALQERIQDARRTLVDQQVLKAAVLDKPIQPSAAHAGSNYDWRYLTAATLFK